MKPQWYQQAIIYEIDLSVFQDSDADGRGDLRGLTSRLDYLSDLGVTCLWLQPIFKSPYQDNGYDVTDFYTIDERWGSMEDFHVFLEEAKSRDLRVLLDLPVNHTSVQHPWFQESRSARDSLRRDWYIWRQERPEHSREGVFGGRVWEYDEQAGAHYHHSFYPFEADLNIANGAVREEIRRIMTHWLKTGIDGFRMDAVPFLLHQEGIEDPYHIARELHECVKGANPDAVLLGEVDLNLVELRQYYGLGAKADQMQMLLNFWLANYMFLSLARGTAQPLTWALSMLPQPPAGGQWANFLRNHDELSLSRLSGEEMRDVLEAFAPEEDMRAYGRGIRRRLSSMLDKDTRRMKLAHSLLLSMPGTPVLYYGDEIGMGDDLSMPEREAVRSPMQWTGGHGAGFSDAPEDQFFRPLIRGGDCGCEVVNVEDQLRDPDSLLCFVRRALHVRRDLAEIGLGDWRVLDPAHAGVLAHRVTYRGEELVFLHNMTDQDITACLEASAELVDVFADRRYAPCDARRIQLDAYGFRWLRTARGTV